MVLSGFSLFSKSQPFSIKIRLSFDNINLNIFCILIEQQFIFISKIAFVIDLNLSPVEENIPFFGNYHSIGTIKKTYTANKC